MKAILIFVIFAVMVAFVSGLKQTQVINYDCIECLDPFGNVVAGPFVTGSGVSCPQGTTVFPTTC
jgi:hypothetical protein